jgi:methionyl aminopeptidase
MVAIRSPREIEKIAFSAQIVADTLAMLDEHIRPGVEVQQLDRLAEEYIRSRGARPAFKGYMGFPATLCVSIDDEVVHGIPDGRILQEGQIVGIDCGAEKDGYYGDAARTYAVGMIDSEKQRLMEVTEAALYKGIAVAKVGNRVSDIGHTIQTYVEAHGYSVVRELVGHGIGTQLHEEPQIPNYGRPGQGYPLRVGMCLAIEPMINMGTEKVYTAEDGWTVRTLDGKSSAHFEHTVVITQDGAKILSVRGDHG